MEKTFLKNDQLHEFLETLRIFGELYGPMINEAGVPAFCIIEDYDDLRLDLPRTQIPPKKFLLPFRDEILQFCQGHYRHDRTGSDSVLFGIHRCDLDSIAYLDLVFMGDPPDPGYAERRARLTLVGTSCDPDDYCFCPEPSRPPACDLFLTACSNGFEVDVHSQRGEAIIQAAAGLLTREELPEIQKKGRSGGVTAQPPELRFSDHPLWEKFARTCVSCGACSVCCPTCYCFDVREYPTITGTGSRVREWDNCLFVTHGEVSGANFRKTRLERLRYRFLHKYCGFTPLQGMTSCVGCGRCRSVCPVDIDLRKLFQPVTEQPGEAP